MPLRKRKTQTLEANNNTNTANLQIKNEESPKISIYEQSREERIKENLERMQKLGLKDLSLKLKASASTKRATRKTPSSIRPPSPLKPPGPLRRSTRLQNAAPVAYSEAVLAKNGGVLEDEDVKLQEGSKPEVYTEEHERLLGNTERIWTLFVDGYGNDGRRLYDQVNGKTCHQCRQKTLGYHTHCGTCNLVQGQFCGDCLYMRYGEHVLEAIENPNWICPACRGICNCSLCRQAKGWPPTGSLYKKISKLGYKSVAHYLIQTQRSKDDAVKKSVNINQVSPKKLLPFSHMEEPSKESLHLSDKQMVPDNGILAAGDKSEMSLLFSHGETESNHVEGREVDQEVHDQLQLPRPELENKTEIKCRHDLTKRALVFFDGGIESNIMESVEANHGDHDNFGSSIPMVADSLENGFKGGEEKELNFVHKELNDSNTALKGCQELGKKTESAVESRPDNIATQLSQRDSMAGSYDNAALTLENDINSISEQCVTSLSYHEPKKENEEDMQYVKKVIAPDSSSRHKKRPVRAEPNIDSIGGRLRQRRIMSKGYDHELPETEMEPLDAGKAFNKKLTSYWTCRKQCHQKV